MIVEEGPYDMVAVFADLDAQMLFEPIIERGQERACTGSFRWRSLRDPRRDVWHRDPIAVLGPFTRRPCRFLLIWDHEGSGREGEPPARLERQVLASMAAWQVAEDSIVAVSISPELERILVPAWSRVKELLADRRGTGVPGDRVILARAGRRYRLAVAGHSIGEVLQRHPKEVFRSLLDVLQIRPSSVVYRDLGERLSIRRIKQDQAVARITHALERWFPPDAPPSTP